MICNEEIYEFKYGLPTLLEKYITLNSVNEEFKFTYGVPKANFENMIPSNFIPIPSGTILKSSSNELNFKYAAFDMINTIKLLDEHLLNLKMFIILVASANLWHKPEPKKYAGLIEIMLEFGIEPYSSPNAPNKSECVISYASESIALVETYNMMYQGSASDINDSKYIKEYPILKDSGWDTGTDNTNSRLESYLESLKFLMEKFPKMLLFLHSGNLCGRCGCKQEEVINAVINITSNYDGVIFWIIEPRTLFNDTIDTIDKTIKLER